MPSPGSCGWSSTGICIVKGDRSSVLQAAAMRCWVIGSESSGAAQNSGAARIRTSISSCCSATASGGMCSTAATRAEGSSRVPARGGEHMQGEGGRLGIRKSAPVMSALAASAAVLQYGGGQARQAMFAAHQCPLAGRQGCNQQILAWRAGAAAQRAPPAEEDARRGPAGLPSSALSSTVRAAAQLAAAGSTAGAAPHGCTLRQRGAATPHECKLPQHCPHLRANW